MTIEIREDKKRAEIWLTRKEASEDHAELSRIISDYKRKKYFVAVFFSGDRDLCEMTKTLLKNNIA